MGSDFFLLVGESRSRQAEGEAGVLIGGAGMKQFMQARTAQGDFSAGLMFLQRLLKQPDRARVAFPDREARQRETRLILPGND